MVARGHSYCYITTATVPRDMWARVQPLLESWKSVLQDLPGFVTSDVMARRTESGDLRMHVRVTWLYREQLEEFLESRWETERLIASTSIELRGIQSEAFENFI
ncbi:MAG TPA: hypothetical protein ENH55_10795 [Aurantimonas coralicida]|uniref:Uncharacterized protein n=2 Tax=root TaxID=1 RepID=A0A9C9ND86_9HYPH|nr:hypothetical protein [Aurantimonas coralicida]HET99450.1 hypothetical protein [Aurantimonas coralicida]